MTKDFATVPIDDVRDYWNARPCNIRHSTAEIGTRKYFDEVEARKYFVEPHIPDFAEFERWRGKKVLEIGCGIGTDTINFARAGALVTAVDLSTESLALAKRRAEVFGFSDEIRFIVADAENLTESIPPEKFDLIYSFGVIHHAPRPEAIISHLRENFSHAGTVLKVMVYYRYSWKVLWMVLLERGRFWKLDEIIAKHSEAQTGCPITYSYSQRTARDLVGDGFEIDNIFVDHIFPYRIQQYVKYEYEYVWYFRILPKTVFRWLERRVGWHLCFVAHVK
ncbi:MAG: class I SAM-dependent methyltransferase [Pyrinomonadaceae bacterium]